MKVVSKFKFNIKVTGSFRWHAFIKKEEQFETFSVFEFAINNDSIQPEKQCRGTVNNSVYLRRLRYYS